MLAPEITAPKITESPFEPTTPIKPSEAIRLGRLKKPRVIAFEFDDGRDGACTFTALRIGYGDGGFRSMFNDFGKHPNFLYMLQKIDRLPSIVDSRTRRGERPEDVEASLIKALEAMGF